MKSYLIDKFLKQDHGNQSSFEVEHCGQKYSGWAIAKPLNCSKEYLPVETRIGMALEVLTGKAIAVHYTEDEIASGETPSLLLDNLGESKEV